MSSTKASSQRETWTGQTAFLLAAVGSAIGLGNIWRFPGVAYTNGGGAFLIPYLVALLFVGLPMLLLDYSIGHRFHGSPPLALKRLAGGRPIAEFIGWFQVAICFVIFCYYAVIIAWSISYTVYSVRQAWGDDTLSFFLSDYLQVDQASTYSLTFVPAIGIPLALVWIFLLLIVARGISRGVELANKIFLPLLVLLFVVMVVRALFLPGALEGLEAFFTPQWSALADTDVWLAAFAQVFFSLSVAFGIMLTYASYLKPRSNLTGTGLVAGFANSSFELLAGIGVFAALGFMAHSQGVAVSDLEGITGPILSFVTFPAIVTMMPGGPLFGVLFFASLTLAGVTSLLSLLQVVSGGLQDKFGFSAPKAALVMGVPAALISLGLFSTQSGLNALDVVDNFINNFGVIASAIALTLVAHFSHIKLSGLKKHLNTVSAIRVPRVWTGLIALIVPVVLAVMFISAVVGYIKEGYGGFDTSYLVVMGWGSIVFAIVFSAVMTALKWSNSPISASEQEEC